MMVEKKKKRKTDFDERSRKFGLMNFDVKISSSVFQLNLWTLFEIN